MNASTKRTVLILGLIAVSLSAWWFLNSHQGADLSVMGSKPQVEDKALDKQTFLVDSEPERKPVGSAENSASQVEQPSLVLDSSEEARTQITVLNEAGQGVSSALIMAKDDGDVLELGESDVTGSLWVESGVVCDSIVVSHPDYALKSVFGGNLDERDLLEIVLEPGAAISGSVLRAETQASLGAGIAVYAWPSREGIIDPRAVVLAGKGSRAVSCTRTDSAGEFTLTGLVPGTAYAVIAAGKGVFSGWQANDVPTETVGLKLLCRQLYAIQFELQSPSGRLNMPNEWSTRWGGDRFISMLPDPGVDAIAVDDCLAKLAGVSLSPLIDDTNVILLQSETWVERIGPLVLSVDLPGYKPAKFDLFAAPLAESIEPEGLFLEPESEAFGSIDLGALDLPPGLIDADPDLFAGVFTLERQSGKSVEIALNFGDLQRGVQLDGIPCDEYRVTFRGNKGYLTLPNAGAPALVIRVPALGAPSRLDLSFKSAASISLSLLDIDGWPVVGRSAFMPMQSNGDQLKTRGTIVSQHAAEHRLPYLLVGAGQYRIEPTRPVIGLQPRADRNASGQLDPPVDLVLKAGEHAQIIWQVIE
jgi:hypothetical protein